MIQYESLTNESQIFESHESQVSHQDPSLWPVLIQQWVNEHLSTDYSLCLCWTSTNNKYILVLSMKQDLSHEPALMEPLKQVHKIKYEFKMTVVPPLKKMFVRFILLNTAL